MRNKWFPLVVLAVMLVFTALVYNQLPAQLPVHWNIEGQVDLYVPAWQGILVVPVVILLLMGVRFVARRLDPQKAAYDSFEGTYYLIINSVVLLMAMVHILMLGTALGWEISLVRVVLIGSGLLIAIIGNELGRVQPNWFVGIRTPWTLADPEVWRETHRMAGRLFFAGGLAAALASLLLPLITVIVVFSTIILLLIGGIIFYSYRLYQVRHVA